MKSDPEESLGYDNANNKADCPPRLVSALPTPKEIAQRAWDNGHVPTFLKALCELLMCSDPWPASTDSEIVVKAKADGMARKLGFSMVASGPFVRSSYHAGEMAEQLL